MNTYTCPHCKQIVRTREHTCRSTRSIHGQMVDSVVVYQPNAPKQNKQSTQSGYMKKFGSKAAK